MQELRARNVQFAARRSGPTKIRTEESSATDVRSGRSKATDENYRPETCGRMQLATKGPAKAYECRIIGHRRAVAREAADDESLRARIIGPKRAVVYAAADGKLYTRIIGLKRASYMHSATKRPIKADKYMIMGPKHAVAYCGARESV